MEEEGIEGPRVTNERGIPTKEAQQRSGGHSFIQVT